MPTCHELDGWIVLEEMILSQPTKDLVLMDEAIKRGQLTLPHHAITTDSDIILAFILFRANLKLINTCHFHVKKLLAL